VRQGARVVVPAFMSRHSPSELVVVTLFVQRVAVVAPFFVVGPTQPAKQAMARTTNVRRFMAT
jgi:hypothetical protein